MDYTAHISSPLGAITLASDGQYLTGLWFEGQKHFGSTLKKDFREERLPVFEETETWLERYFGGEIPGQLPPLKLGGTDFQKTVWEILLTVPYGGTTTYGAIAAAIALKRNGTGVSAQAVGGAVGRNPISILVPCHRVLGADGSLTGYAGGIDRKQRLLDLEQANAAQRIGGKASADSHFM